MHEMFGSVHTTRFANEMNIYYIQCLVYILYKWVVLIYIVYNNIKPSIE